MLHAGTRDSFYGEEVRHADLGYANPGDRQEPDLAEELATNPFLRCDQPAVIAAARAHGAASADPVEVFAALRAWRNVFA